MKYFILLGSLCITLFTHAQTDTCIFNTIKKVQANDYVFSVPEKWTWYQQQRNGPQLEKLDFTDVALPHLLNGAPLTATCIFRKIACDSLRAAEEFITTEFTSYPDRVTPAGYNYLVDTLTIASGEQALLYSTHYYRRSRVSNYTRYDLLAYSPKRTGAYVFTVTFQYKDPTYQLEADLKLKQYVVKIFRSLVLR
jgi:hypothetical protein